MTAEGTRPVRTELRVRIIKVIKSQGAAHTCIQIPITNPECPIPPAAAARPADDGVRTRSRQRTHNVSEGATGKMSVGSKVESSPCIRLWITIARLDVEIASKTAGLRKEEIGQRPANGRNSPAGEIDYMLIKTLVSKGRDTKISTLFPRESLIFYALGFYK